MICEECPLRERCYERRGICRDYILYMERVERTRRKIEQLNEDYKKAAAGKRADKGGVQKAGDRRRKVYQGPAERLQAKARTDTEAQAEAESVPEAAEVEGNGKAGSPQRTEILDGVQGQEAHRDV